MNRSNKLEGISKPVLTGIGDILPRRSIGETAAECRRYVILKGPLVAMLLLIFAAQKLPCCFSQDTEMFRWELKPSEKLAVTLIQTTGIKTNIATRSQNIGNTMILEMDWEVVSATEEQFEFHQSISRIKLTINAPSKSGIQITEIDTAAEKKTTPLGETLLQQVQSLVGAKFIVTMTPRGEITNVTIPKDSLELIRLAPSSMPIRELLTEKGLKDLFGQSAIVFPDQPINNGEKWSMENDNLSEEISKTGTVTYIGKTESDGNELHKFELTTEVSDVPDNDNSTSSSNEDESNTKMKIEEFVGGGKILFAPEGDVIVQSELSNRLTTTRNYREKSIRTTVTTDVKMKVSRNND